MPHFAFKLNSMKYIIRRTMKRWRCLNRCKMVSLTLLLYDRRTTVSLLELKRLDLSVIVGKVAYSTLPHREICETTGSSGQELCRIVRIKIMWNASSASALH